MNWFLLATIAAQLINPLQIGSTTSVSTSTPLSQMTAEFQTVSATSGGDSPSLRQLPYTIDTDEIQGAFEILTGVDSVYVHLSTTVPVFTSVNDYVLPDSQGETIAQEVFIPGFKETVVFDARNTVLAVAFLDYRLGGWPSLERQDLYGRFDQDPNFDIIVQRVKAAKGLRQADQEILNLIAQLTQDVAVDYLQEKGLIESEGDTNPEDSH